MAERLVVNTSLICDAWIRGCCAVGRVEMSNSEGG